MSIRSNFNVSQQAHQLHLQKQVQNSGQNAAAHNVAHGHTKVSKKQSESHEAETTEESTLSEAARQAIEDSELKKAEEDGGATNAQQASGKKKTKEHKSKDSKAQGGEVRGGEHEYLPGEMTPTSEGNFVVHGESEEEDFEITGAQASRLGTLDSPKHAREKVLGDMPEHVRKASENMIAEKTDTEQKRERHADLKDGSKEFADQVEGVILEPAESFRAAGKRPASLRGPKQEKPMVAEDPYSEELVRELAKEQLAQEGSPDEAFVA
jgi:hypothetical protein